MNCTEITAITNTVRDYVEGMVFNDEAKLRRAFHAKAAIIGHFVGGRFEWLSLDQFAEAIKGPGPAPAGSEAVWDVISVDISGDSAVVKINDEFAGLRFTDTLSLLKIEGAWRIVNKIYYLHG